MITPSAPDYIELRPLGDGEYVARTIAITDRINLDVSADGSVIGVESIAGPIEKADLVRVLEELRFPAASSSPDTPKTGDQL